MNEKQSNSEGALERLDAIIQLGYRAHEALDRLQNLLEGTDAPITTSSGPTPAPNGVLPKIDDVTLCMQVLCKKLDAITNLIA